MFHRLICIFILINHLLHEVKLDNLKGNIQETYRKKVYIGKYSQKIRLPRQSMTMDDWSGELSRFPDNIISSNEERRDFGGDEDVFIFDDGVINFRSLPRQISIDQQNSATTVSVLEIPGMGTRKPACEETCPSTQEYNPVCGDDNVTYPNLGKLQCASRCGKRVSLQFRGACLGKARGR